MSGMTTFLRGGFSPEVYRDNRPEIALRNAETLRRMARFSFAAWALLWLLSCFVPLLAGGRSVYLCLAAISWAADAARRAQAGKPGWPAGLLYVCASANLLAALWLEGLLYPGARPVAFVCLISVLPGRILDRPWRPWLLSLALTLGFCLCAALKKPLETWPTDAAAACAGMLIGWMLGYANVRAKLSAILLERALAAEEARCRALLDGGADAVLDYDRGTGALHVSEGGRACFDPSLPGDQALTRARVHPDDLALYRRMLASLRGETAEAFRGELRLLNAAGEPNWYDARVSGAGEGDSAAHGVCALTDIGRWKRLDEVRAEENRVAIMLSQIQPHFIYNALNTIQYYCQTDPQTAADAIEHFSRFLRVNMDSLSQKEPIPFDRELEHLNNYLRIEQLRFDDIRVVYDIGVTSFQIPALTLQPLVENAIRYGLRPKKGGGTVRISTLALADGAQIEIADDGVGFDPFAEQADGRSHIGISNTRNRLKTMVRGSLSVESVPGEGTRVTILLPRQDREEAASCT